MAALGSMLEESSERPFTAVGSVQQAIGHAGSAAGLAAIAGAAIACTRRSSRLSELPARGEPR